MLLCPCPLPGLAPQQIDHGKHSNVVRRAIAGLEAWMLRFIRRNGFWGIFLLSAWPNAAFDLCGLACGNFRMPFATFFGATLLGKGVAKVNGQVRRSSKQLAA